MALAAVSLDDKYALESGRVYLTGTQALVRLPLMQRRRDVAAGLNTAGFISGYRGSPLGSLDMALWRAARFPADHHLHFQPGFNEDLAATAIYGTQLLDQLPRERFDGVNGIWYGKAPGVDRTGDAFRHGNYIGTSKFGSALALGGDDPAAKSSTIPGDSTVAFYDLYFPLLFPGDPEEVLEFGLHGIAMSRYSGLWSAMKIVTNVADGRAVIDGYPGKALPVCPAL